MRQYVKKGLGSTLFLVLLSGLASASKHGVQDILNKFFLPKGVEVSGVLGVSFVVASFLIVAVLLYIGMSRVFPERESLVLSLTIAFFVIPSGGYKWISGFFLTLFRLGGITFKGGEAVKVGAPSLPLDIILPLLTFLAVTLLMLRFGNEFQTYEFLAAAAAAFFVFLALDGGMTALGAAFGWLIVFIFGLHVFGEGMGAGGMLGYLVGGIGLFAVLWTFQSLQVFPESIQGFTQGLAALTAFLIVAILSLIILGVVLVIDKVRPGPAHPWNPL